MILKKISDRGNKQNPKPQTSLDLIIVLTALFPEISDNISMTGLQWHTIKNKNHNHLIN